MKTIAKLLAVTALVSILIAGGNTLKSHLDPVQKLIELLYWCFCGAIAASIYEVARPGN